MNARESRTQPLRYARTSRRRKMVLNVDLNTPPPSESIDQEGTSAGPSQAGQEGQQGTFLPPMPIDLEAIDDDVVISSPTAFAEAQKNSRANHRRTVVVDVDSEEQSSWVAPKNQNKRHRGWANQMVVNCGLYINLEGSSKAAAAVPPRVQLPPPPKEPTFTCPVCMNPLVEETSTKCGHIFCKACIRAAIASQSKCPTCRRKTTMKDIIRVYLPAST